MTRQPLPIPTEDEATDAWLYELLHRGQRGDKAFYRRVCEGAAHVLEAGVGWGRLLDPLSRAARRVTGLDQHPGLLARAADRVASLPKSRAARVHLSVADLTTPPDATPPYDRVLLPFNTLFCLPDEAAQRAALQALRRVAAPGALLALDVYVIDDAPPDADDADFEYLITVLDAAGRVDVYERNDELPDQRIDVTYRCALFDALTSTEPRRVVEQRVSHRYLTPDQLLTLLPACGWTPRSVHGDFAGHALTAESGVVVVVAEAT